MIEREVLEASELLGLLEGHGWTGVLIDSFDEFDDGVITYRFDIWREV